LFSLVMHQRTSGADLADWRPYAPYVRRVIIAGLLAIVITAPMIIALTRVALDPNIAVKLGFQAGYYTPDLLHLIVPSIHQAIGGRVIYPEYDVAIMDLTRRSIISSLTARYGWYGSGIETAINIPIAAIVLMFFARRARAGLWLLFGAVFAVLAL